MSVSCLVTQDLPPSLRFPELFSGSGCSNAHHSADPSSQKKRLAAATEGSFAAQSSKFGSQLSEFSAAEYHRRVLLVKFNAVMVVFRFVDCEQYKCEACGKEVQRS